MRVRCVLVLLSVALLVPASRANAARIDFVTATTNMGSGFGTLLANTVNGVGLNALTLTALHGPTIPSNSWVSSSGVLTGQVTFDLGQEYSVSGFSFWNQNAGGPGAMGSTGIQLVNVLFSTDGLNFLLLGPAVFARVTVPGPIGPQMFSFAAITATHLRFGILSNYGDAFQTGFAEVGFDGVPVGPPIPEPTTVSLIGGGLAYLVARRRRRAAR